MREAYRLLRLEIRAQRDCAFELLGLVEREAQDAAEVVRYVVPSDRQQAEVLRASVGEYRDAGRPSSDVYDRGSGKRVFGSQHSERSSERFDDEAADVEARAADAVHDVLYRRGRDDYRLHLDVEAHRVHSERVVYPDVAVERILDRDSVQYRLVRRHNDVCLRRVDDAFDVEAHDRARRASERDHALRADARHFAAAESDGDLADVLPYHVLRVANGLAHRLHGLVEVDDQPLTDAVGRSLTDADYLRFVAL